jgi:FkbM family methyltransferase
MKIYYGIKSNYIDVTEICLSKLMINNIITIPNGDNNRADKFTDPLSGILKKIFIVINNNFTEYEDYYIIKINTIDNTINTINIHEMNNEINTKLAIIHSKLKIKYGTLNEEFVEQTMAVRYLTGNEKVLEIGGNIGRNSLVIASILSNDKNLVTLESDPDIAKQLEENRDLNNLNFYIEGSALSNTKMIQHSWDTVKSDILLEGYKWVNTITLNEFKNKYKIEFDTLILDCEGAFYYILMDTPEILDNINLIIMENDYHDVEHKEYVDKVLKQNNFYVDCSQGGWWENCPNNFYEVWKKAN